MSNPLTILFFLAFLPNFTRDGATLVPAVMSRSDGYFQVIVGFFGFCYNTQCFCGESRGGILC